MLLMVFIWATKAHYMNIIQIFTQKIWANNWTGTLRKLSILENLLGKVSSDGL